MPTAVEGKAGYTCDPTFLLKKQAPLSKGVYMLSTDYEANNTVAVTAY